MDRRLLLVVAATSLALSLASVTAAHAAVPPHVSVTDDTDSCAMCHRVKTSPTSVNSEFSRVDASETGDAADLKNALLVGSSEAVTDDTGLCFTCHGREHLGSAIDVQSAFETASAHVLAPGPSLFGRSPKQCSTCHDSHGEDRVAGEPRAALLRSFVSTANVVYEGVAYCATCHADRPADLWDGVAVWERTAHASVLPTPSTGTGITCSVCHDPHGSPYAPSIRTRVAPPAVLNTMTVSANDRTFCLLCHPTGAASWDASATYAPSAHASSAATVAITGEYVARDLTSEESSRAVGECQNCHAAMGRSDGEGGTVPKLLARGGRALCDDCHDDDGPAGSNIATMAFQPSQAATEVVAIWRPSVETSIYGDAAVYTRDVTDTVPAALDGPRVFAPSRRTGDASAGDIDGDGVAELIVGDPGSAHVDVFDSDPVKGLRRTTLAVPGGVKPYLVTAANAVQHGSGPHGAADARAEIVVVERDPLPPHSSSVHAYTFDGDDLVVVGAPLAAGNDASSLSAGDVTGTARADLIVTAAGDDRFRIFTESAGALALASGPHVTGSAPTGASIGDVWESRAGDEIVICNSGTTTNNIALYDGDGDPLAVYTTSGDAGANRAYDSVVADILWDVPASGSPRAEVVVALRSDPTTDSVDATSTIDVFPQVGGVDGLSAAGRLNYVTGPRFESSAVEAGDVDGDGRAEAVVGNSGKWLRGGLRQAPSLQVFDSAAGTTLTLSRTLWATGVEQASGIRETTTTALGTAPAVVVAELGAVGPSRHPADAGDVAHVSTETASFSRHVTCADCHNAHEATATVQTAPSAVYGALKGAYGVTIVNNAPGSDVTYAQKRGATAEYQVCLKCHSAYADLDGTRNVAAEVNALNASTHAVQAPSVTASAPASTFEAPLPDAFVNNAATWTKDSRLYCIDCHTNSDESQAAGPHTSAEGSLLRAPVWGVTPGDPDLLCYLCHKRSIYFGGAAGSEFYHFSKGDMHKLHTSDTGFSCRTCHVSHGAPTLPHLQNADHAYEHTELGGACTTQCHTGGARHAYSRSATIVTPSSLEVLYDEAGTTGETAAAVAARGDASLLTVWENNGASPAYSIEMTFTGVAALPSGVEFYGRYQGSPGHIVQVQAWDYSAGGGGAWDVASPLGAWPSTAALGTFTFPTPKAAYLSGSTMRIRVIHNSPGNPNHRHLLDLARLIP